MIEKKFIVTRDSNQLAFGHIPESICNDINRDLEVDWFMGVVLVHSGELQGTMVIGGKQDQAIPEKEEVLAFSGVTANAIKRMRAEEETNQLVQRMEQILSATQTGLQYYRR